MKNIDYDEKVKALFDDIVLVIVDECHRSTSKSFVEILKAINAPMRLGLSGTPNKKEDDRDLLLHSHTGSIVYEMGVSKLKEAGTISKAHLVSVIIDKPVLREDLDWLEAYDSLIVNNTYRHKVISKLVFERATAGKTILVLAGNSLALADNLYRYITKLVDTADVRMVNGLSDNKLVDSAFKDLQDKKVKVVITTTIADEGIDIPAINCLVVAGGGKSFVKTIQRVGRVLRLKDDGGHAEILDVMDNTNDYLRKHAKERINWYEMEDLFDSSEIVKAEDV
jgi:superfamily II DNA or RNA helicase